MANTLTENYGLLKPANGDDNWDVTLNSNLDAIDELIYEVNQVASEGLGGTGTGGVYIDTVTGFSYTIAITNGIIVAVLVGGSSSSSFSSIIVTDGAGNFKSFSMVNGSLTPASTSSTTATPIGLIDTITTTHYGFTLVGGQLDAIVETGSSDKSSFTLIDTVTATNYVFQVTNGALNVTP